MIFDVRSRERLYRLRGHQNSVTCSAFSLDGRLLATGSEDRSIRIWNVNTGTIQHVIAAHGDAIYSLTFSPDGRTIASGGEHGMIAFSHVETGRFLFDTKVGSDRVNWLEFLPDGQILAATDDRKSVHLLFAPGDLANEPKEPDQGRPPDEESDNYQ